MKSSQSKPSKSKPDKSKPIQSEPSAGALGANAPGAGAPREASGFRRSPCAVANALDIFGDKWSLLVVRDLFSGKRTYGELADSPEGIPTNILADRLKRLESAGIITSAAYQERPVRYAYTLTGKGSALGDVLLALVRWGKEYIPGTIKR